MKRRAFSKSIVASIGLSTMGNNLFFPSKTKLYASGNSWSSKGLKLGISHQKAGELNEKHFNYLRQMGVEYLEIRIPSNTCSLDNLILIRDKVENAGLKVFEIMLSDKYNCKAIALAQPEREREIKFFIKFIKDLSKAGIDTTTYAWHTGGAYQTGTTIMRSCQTRLFEQQSAEAMPNLYDKEYSDEEMWDNYEYFIKQVLPVAEDVGVRLQLHPNDPPVTHQGVARIFRSVTAFRRAMDIANHSPYSGILFCVGCFAEMYGPEGKGEDIVKAIYEFGSRNHIYQVHFRNVNKNLPNFYETFPDNGYVNMYGVMKALGQVNFNGIVVPDHVPRCIDSEAGPVTAEAYIFGYIRALINAVDTELGRMS